MWRSLTALAVTATAATAGLAPAHSLTSPIPPLMSDVIVQQWDGADPAPAAALQLLGGTVTAPLPIVGGFAATVPTAVLDTIASLPGVRVVSPDAPVSPEAVTDGTLTKPSPWRSVVGANTTRS